MKRLIKEEKFLIAVIAITVILQLSDSLIGGESIQRPRSLENDPYAVRSLSRILENVMPSSGGDSLFYRDTRNTRIGIGTVEPQSTLHVANGYYAQFSNRNAGAPSAGDCDEDTEWGRMAIDTSNNRLYICNGASRGWDYTALTN